MIGIHHILLLYGLPQTVESHIRLSDHDVMQHKVELGRFLLLLFRLKGIDYKLDVQRRALFSLCYARVKTDDFCVSDFYFLRYK